MRGFSLLINPQETVRTKNNPQIQEEILGKHENKQIHDDQKKEIKEFHPENLVFPLNLPVILNSFHSFLFPFHNKIAPAKKTKSESHSG